jgi:hypothetical protein
LSINLPIELLEQEEVMWRQRSRVEWLAAGDNNTRFFHLRAIQRMKKNRVTELLRGDGTLDEARGTGLTGKQFLYRFVYFIRVQGMEEVLELVPTKVCAHMNAMLDAPFYIKEVKAA